MYSKGDWEIERNPSGQPVIIHGEDDYICGFRNQLPRPDEKTIEANAKLIAAAPEMIETLQEVQSIITSDKRFNIKKDFHLYNILACVIKAAIAKAK